VAKALSKKRGTLARRNLKKIPRPLKLMEESNSSGGEKRNVTVINTKEKQGARRDSGKWMSMEKTEKRHNSLWGCQDAGPRKKEKKGERVFLGWQFKKKIHHTRVERRKLGTKGASHMSEVAF